MQNITLLFVCRSPYRVIESAPILNKPKIDLLVRWLLHIEGWTEYPDEVTEHIQRELHQYALQVQQLNSKGEVTEIIKQYYRSDRPFEISRLFMDARRQFVPHLSE